MKGFYNFPNFIREMSDLRIYIFKRLLLGGEVGSLKIFNKSVRWRIQSQLHPSAPKINKKTIHKIHESGCMCWGWGRGYKIKINQKPLHQTNI